MTWPSLLRPGVTCWRVARSRRLSFLVDGEAYYGAARAALLKARRSVLLLGWDFDPRVPLQPGRTESEGCPMYRLLRELVAERPELEVRILIWDMSRLIAMSREVPPQRAGRWLPGARLEFRLDATHPPGASHHQKLLVVDDAVAFCGGADFAHNRWDTTEHRDVEERRRSPGGKPYKPRHDVMVAVDDAAAAALETSPASVGIARRVRGRPLLRSLPATAGRPRSCRT